MPYKVKDISLAPQGEKKIRWVQEHMPVLERIKSDFSEEKPFKGVTIGSCLHLEPKTINLGLTLQAGGAEVAMTGCNPLSTQDDATAAGAKMGLNMYGWRGETNEEYYENIHRVLDHEPEILIDDGADMIFLVHRERPELLDGIIGACEETTTGINRLRAMAADGALKFPVMAVNDAYTKYLFDNRYGTGQSTFDSIMGTTNMLIAGKTVVVCGYGWCGRGIAMRAEGLGASVIVTEVDPIRALEARMDGFRVMKVSDAVKEADILITATGNTDVVSESEFMNMKDGCVMANSGHFNVEINREALEELSRETEKVKEDIEVFIMPDGRKLYLLAEGRLVNLASERGQGHPAEIMDMSFAMQVLSARHLLQEKPDPGVYRAPDEIDLMVARMKLDAMGIDIDELTEKQRLYLENWEEGT
ncbi:adenosylhomocysteinase [Methanothermobacter defluvii]|uniref:S-inosyl-L-homocysteine hydrolase n=1 Tax=Methanothermobacter defluvii TaxID=49339 RepID=A0A371ND16_9EURY|nr:adenosylhomocysteinase [Methanothermobacter defluvii]REE26310.1 adenosylhomocysteinase [Methanothermobacter defluvii]HOQ18414.1 adenosylhomocysteinase [Methanothermobacter thermautotrophicus]